MSRAPRCRPSLMTSLPANFAVQRCSVALRLLILAGLLNLLGCRLISGDLATAFRRSDVQTEKLPLPVASENRTARRPTISDQTATVPKLQWQVNAGWAPFELAAGQAPVISRSRTPRWQPLRRENSAVTKPTLRMHPLTSGEQSELTGVDAAVLWANRHRSGLQWPFAAREAVGLLPGLIIQPTTGIETVAQPPANPSTAKPWSWPWKSLGNAPASTTASATPAAVPLAATLSKDDENWIVSQRAAAAFGFCCALPIRPIAESASRPEIAVVQQWLREPSLPDAVRFELWRGLALHLPPNEIVGIQPENAVATVARFGRRRDGTRSGTTDQRIIRAQSPDKSASIGEQTSLQRAASSSGIATDASSPSNSTAAGSAPISVAGNPAAGSNPGDSRSSSGIIDSPERLLAILDTCVIHAAQRLLTNVASTNEAPHPVSLAHDPVPGEQPLASDAVTELYPAAIWQAQWHSDPRIRQRFGMWVSVARPPRAFEILQGQLLDQAPLVSESAIVQLGVLGSSEAIAELRSQFQRSEERYRLFAVRGLALSSSAILNAAAADASPMVRAEAVRRLADYGDHSARQQLGNLLRDSSIEVQLAVLQASIQQPWANDRDRILPLLCRALMESPGFKTRQLALQELRQRLGANIEFPLEAPPRQRAELVAAIRKEWKINESAIPGEAPDAGGSGVTLVEIRAAEISEQLKQWSLATDPAAKTAAVNWMNELSRDDLQAIELALETATESQRTFILAELLPTRNDEYKCLKQLQDSNVAVRRSAAAALARIGQQSTLRYPVLQELARVIPREQDLLVWRQVMQAVENDATDRAARLAQLACHHAWPDIRVLGCEYVGRHGRPQHAIWLADLLNDQSVNVQLAAVVAAGKCRNPILADGTGLRDSIGKNRSDATESRPAADGSQPLGANVPAANMSADSNGDAAALVDANSVVPPAESPGSTAASGETNPLAQVEAARFTGLRSLLMSPHASVRFAAVESLSNMGDEAGRQELLRLAADPSAEVRLRVIRAMGTSGQSRFVENLVRMAWVETDSQMRLAAVASLKQLVPSGEQPVVPENALPAVAAEAWVTWWSQRNGTGMPVSASRLVESSARSAP